MSFSPLPCVHIAFSAFVSVLVLGMGLGLVRGGLGGALVSHRLSCLFQCASSEFSEFAFILEALSIATLQ